MRRADAESRLKIDWSAPWIQITLTLFDSYNGAIMNRNGTSATQRPKPKLTQNPTHYWLAGNFKRQKILQSLKMLSSLLRKKYNRSFIILDQIIILMSKNIQQSWVKIVYIQASEQQKARQKEQRPRSQPAEKRDKYKTEGYQIQYSDLKSFNQKVKRIKNSLEQQAGQRPQQLLLLNQSLAQSFTQPFQEDYRDTYVMKMPSVHQLQYFIKTENVPAEPNGRLQSQFTQNISEVIGQINFQIDIGLGYLHCSLSQMEKLLEQ